MKIYNQDKTQILENPDLTKGYLKEEKIVIKTIPAIKEKYHYETIKEYENGGKTVEKIIDVVGVPETYEYEYIKIYIPYTEEQLKQSRINEIKLWFEEYDNQVKQYQRCVRLGIEFDKDIVELDNQAKTYQEELRQLKLEVSNGK